ncbi:hypothetical protein Pan216_02080 [Planctomycetes bacterium Pan216]|uniref:MoxR-vWA-beta-propeller ternary system domain-containing protein n=1 Tax=Kolteria novifilia TaxID=2527975 RepID=A0A518AXH1_9BACT|nr:hypothetical protein Pan216_02080 [Planctomycetes bacterium Pan216]
MINVPLTIELAPTPLRRPHALYLPGNDLRGWLEELTSWDVAQSSLKLLVVPRSARERTPAGLLAVLPEEAISAVGVGRGVPFGLVAGQLYLPTTARFDPAVSDDELTTQLGGDRVFVWHPTLGLTAFEENDRLGVADLLSWEAPQRDSWGCAMPGERLAPRIVSLGPAFSLTIETLLRDGQDDIGTKSDALDELPPHPEEPNPTSSFPASRHVSRAVAKLTVWVTQRLPAKPSDPTWVNRLEEWALRYLARSSPGINDDRDREIFRLLKMLEENPDEGLRYALPLTGDAHRGIATPRRELQRREVDFNLSRLGGGGPANFWDVDANVQYRLQARYRELANREMRIGRHRRAAYIFAELLGDDDAAARALVDGGHWREAATLYEKRLKLPLKAAGCLEQGQLWTEAAALYETHGEHERAGDLYAKLDQFDRARTQYRLAVEKHRERHDRLGAAELLLGKLASPDEGLAELRGGWPESDRARHCLNKLFDHLGRLGRHEEASETVTTLRSQSLPQDQAVDAVAVLAQHARSYPNPAVQRFASDTAVVMSSALLPEASPNRQRKLLKSIAALAPEDRLLLRDCERYERERGISDKRSGAKRRRGAAPRLVKTIPLPDPAVAWREAITLGDTFYVAGTHERGHVVVCRCDGNGVDTRLARWPIVPARTESPIVLTGARGGGRTPVHVLLVHAVGQAPFEKGEHLYPSDTCRADAMLGGLGHATESTVGAATGSSGMTWVLEHRLDHLNLVALGGDGKQVATRTVGPIRPLPLPTPEEDSSITTVSTTDVDALDPERPRPYPILAREPLVYVGCDQFLYAVRNDTDPVDGVMFEQRIVSIVGSAPHTRDRIVVTFARGAKFYWGSVSDGQGHEIAEEMDAPIACLNKGGYVILASEHCCEVYSTRDQRLKRVASDLQTGIRPVAVLPGPEADQFVLVSDTGEISHFRIS